MADEEHKTRSSDYEITPRPDPTELTRIASDRLERMLRELVKAEIEHVQVLSGEKFKGIESRFTQLELRTAEQKADTTKALTDALAAQQKAAESQADSFEKATEKSEKTTTENIKGVAALLQSSTKASDDKYDGLKERVVALESRQIGNLEGTTKERDHSSDTRGWITVVVAILGLIFSVVIGLAAYSLGHGGK